MILYKVPKMFLCLQNQKVPWPESRVPFLGASHLGRSCGQLKQISPAAGEAPWGGWDEGQPTLAFCALQKYLFPGVSPQSAVGGVGAPHTQVPMF